MLTEEDLAVLTKNKLKNNTMIKQILNKLLSTQDSVPLENRISFKESMDLAELPIVTFYQGNQKINFLLDSGSNNCIIDSNILNKLDHTLLNMSTNLCGMEGTDNVAQICSLETTYKDNIYKYAYIIQDMSVVFGKIKKDTGVTINGILGTKFFNDYKYVLDFDELIAYSKK